MEKQRSTFYGGTWEHQENKIKNIINAGNSKDYFWEALQLSHIPRLTSFLKNFTPF
jgi:hypothetical protein